MSTLLVLNTTRRDNGFEYFKDTIARMDAAGAAAIPKEDKLVYCDGPFEGDVPEGWTLQATPASLGTIPSLRDIVSRARMRGSDLAFFEDDIKLCKNAVTKIVDYVVPKDLAFVSFFDFYTAAGAKKGLEKRPFPEKGVIQSGVQAIKIPLSSLQLMWPDAEHAELILPHDGKSKQFGRLYALKYFFGILSPLKQFGMFLPHLVQHVGEVSAVNGVGMKRMLAEGKKRESANYAGDDADALKL